MSGPDSSSNLNDILLLDGCLPKFVGSKIEDFKVPETDAAYSSFGVDGVVAAVEFPSGGASSLGRSSLFVVLVSLEVVISSLPPSIVSDEFGSLLLWDDGGALPQAGTGCDGGCGCPRSCCDGSDCGVDGTASSPTDVVSAIDFPHDGIWCCAVIESMVSKVLEFFGVVSSGEGTDDDVDDPSTGGKTTFVSVASSNALAAVVLLLYTSSPSPS